MGQHLSRIVRNEENQLLRHLRGVLLVEGAQAPASGRKLGILKGETCVARMKRERGSNSRGLIGRMTKYFIIQTRMHSIINYMEGKGELLINMLRQDINCNYLKDN